MLVCLPACGLLRRNGARPARNGRFARPCDRSPYTYMSSGPDSRVLATARRIHIRRRVAVLRDSSHFRGFRPAGGGEASRAWHPREFGAVLGGSASLPLPAAPLPPSSRRYAPQRFVGGYTSSPCDVSHRASGEPRRRMSLSSALAPSSLASPSTRRVFLRSFCARRRPVSSLNLVRVSTGAKRSRRRRVNAGCKSAPRVAAPSGCLRQGDMRRLGRGASPRRPLSRVSPGAKRSRRRRTQCGVQIRRAGDGVWNGRKARCLV